MVDTDLLCVHAGCLAYETIHAGIVNHPHNMVSLSNDMRHATISNAKGVLSAGNGQGL
jgi:hypothetical protein